MACRYDLAVDGDEPTHQRRADHSTMARHKNSPSVQIEKFSCHDVQHLFVAITAVLLEAHRHHIGVHHFSNERVEGRLVTPTQLVMRLTGIAK